jgi:hypothetical protein
LVLWGAVAFVAVLGSFWVIQFPFLRIGIAFIFVFVLMMISKFAMRGR